MSYRTALLRINSDDRENILGSTTSNFVVNFRNAPHLQSIKGIVLKHAGLPNNIYNVDQFNNVFSYWQGAGITQFTVPVGQYEWLDFKIAFEAAALANGTTMVLTLNATTGRLAITNTPNIRYYNKLDGNPMGDILGITISTPPTALDQSSYQSLGLLNLMGEGAVYIRSPQLANSAQFINKTTMGDPIIGSIPMNSCFGSMVHWESPDGELDLVDYHDSRSGTSLQMVAIQIVDGRGRIVDLNNGNVNLIVRVYY